MSLKSSRGFASAFVSPWPLRIFLKMVEMLWIYCGAWWEKDQLGINGCFEKEQQNSLPAMNPLFQSSCQAVSCAVGGEAK
jgi:hypothetical protein